MNSKRERKLRVAAYFRVASFGESTMDTLAVQKRYWTDKIDGNPRWENAGIFSDEGAPVTAMKNQGGFLEMLRHCQEGQISLILVKSMSRFGRSPREVLSVLRELKALGTDVAFEKEGFDTFSSNWQRYLERMQDICKQEANITKASVHMPTFYWGRTDQP